MRTEQALTRELIVACEPDAAFATFTQRIGEWWPLRTHSISADRVGTPARTVAFEPRVGGRLFETAPSGDEHSWGEVRAWAPPGRLVFSWRIGREDELATEVEVTFAPAPGGTLVRLEHRGWEIWGERLDEVRASYEGGWGTVLAAFAAAA